MTTEEIAELLGVPRNEVPPIAARWRAKGHAFAPTRGAYVPIPPEFRTWGAVPASHFIDALMSYLGHDYYVGFLSAAEAHGAGHQRPQVFQVVTSGRLRNRAFGRVRIEFVTASETAARPVVARNTPTGTMRVATSEVTVLDLVGAPRHGGGLSNVATVIGELLGDQVLDLDALVRVAADYPVSVRQRAGLLLERVAALLEITIDLSALTKSVKGAQRILLLPSADRDGPTAEPWNVVVNTDIEPDL